MGSEIKKLKDIAEIITGYQSRDKYDNGNIPYIQQKDIDQTKVDIEKFSKINLLNFDRYCVREDDLLQVVRGSRFPVFLIDKELEGSVPSGQFYRIRIKQPNYVLPKYVFHFINSEKVKNRIRLMARGSGIPMLPKDEIENLRIPIPCIEKQIKIVQLCELAEREMELCKSIIEKRIKLVSSMFSENK
jgi:type I restriction enzyme S subunit